MYPFHQQVYLFHESPIVERDSATVTFDIDLLYHMQDFADNYVYDDFHHHVDDGWVMETELDLSMLTKNLNIIVEIKSREKKGNETMNYFIINFWEMMGDRFSQFFFLSFYK